MILEQDELELLKGKKGPIWQKIIKTVVRYGEVFGAERLVPIDGPAHFVTSFGLSTIEPFLEILEELVNANITVKMPFTVDPRPIDTEIEYSKEEKAIFDSMYSHQARLEKLLLDMELLNENAFTCTCYLKEVGNIPKRGQILAWSESSAVVYANSVIGARTNRNAAGIDILCNILGKAPYFGLLTDEGRQASWLIEVKTKELPNPQLLGSAIGLRVMEDVPYIVGLSDFLGDKLTDDVKDYLKDMGAAAASNGAVGLYHVEDLTPEAKDYGESLLKKDYKTYVIDDEELKRIYKSYPILWKDPNTKPALCFIGCPHASLNQIYWWYENLKERLSHKKVKKVNVPTYICAAPAVIDEFKKDKEAYNELIQMGVKLTYICPLMYMSNPLCAGKPVITNSNKLRTYSTARFYPDEQLLDILCNDDEKGGIIHENI